MAPKKLLLTGATGFIGGTILTSLLNSSEDAVKALSITAVVRRDAQAKFFASKGINTVLVDSLDDAEKLEEAASKHDIVVNAALGHHVGAPKALIIGLGKRKKETGGDVHYFHLSGTTCVSVPSFREIPYKLRTFSDLDTDIFEYEKEREAAVAYLQRTTDIAVIETGESADVPATIVMPATVFGTGTGWYKTQSHQIPVLINNAINTGYPEHILSGQAQSGVVHVVDLAELYVLLVAKTLRGEAVDSGRQGYYFAETGELKWGQVTSLIGEVGVQLGALKSAEPQSVDVQTAGGKFGDGNETIAELCFGSNSCTKPDRSYQAGWKPKKTGDDWKASVKETFEAILKQRSEKA